MTGGLASLAPDAPATVAIRVELVGGFTTPAMLAARLPMVTVYSDGRIITDGPQVQIYPSTALPSLQVRRISPPDVQRLVDFAVIRGVGRMSDLGEPPISDSGSTRFTVVTASGTRTSEAYALRFEPPTDVASPSDLGSPSAGTTPPDGLTPAQRSARTDLLSLVGTLTDPATLLGAGAVTDVGAYDPGAVSALSAPWVDPGQEVALPEVTWPGPTLPGTPVGGGLATACVTTSGVAAQQVLAAARGASALTPWTSGGKRWIVALRPLLPDERGCTDLRK